MENHFALLMVRATRYYKNDFAYPLAKFYYEYGSLLLTLVENKVDLFGNIIKKENEVADIKANQADPEGNNQ